MLPLSLLQAALQNDAHHQLSSIGLYSACRGRQQVFSVPHRARACNRRAPPQPCGPSCCWASCWVSALLGHLLTVSFLRRIL